MPRLEWWENQTFLGVESTFGDDRSLTNCVLRDWRIVYERRAVSHTIVPITFRAFLIQQTRWKRSWTRESLLVAGFIWRKHPIAALFTYMSILLPLLAPIAAMHSLVWAPLFTHPAAPADLPRRDLRAGARLLLLLPALPRPLQRAVAVRDPVRLLLPRDHAVADLLRDRHRRTAAWGTRPATAGLVGGGRGDGDGEWRRASQRRLQARRPGSRRFGRRGRSRCCYYRFRLLPVVLLGALTARARRRDAGRPASSGWFCQASARRAALPLRTAPAIRPGASRLERDIFAPVAASVTPQSGCLARSPNTRRARKGPTRRLS